MVLEKEGVSIEEEKKRFIFSSLFFSTFDSDKDRSTKKKSWNMIEYKIKNIYK